MSLVPCRRERRIEKTHDSAREMRPTSVIPRLLVRLAAAVVLVAGVLKTWDAITGASATVRYAPDILVAIGVAEAALAAWALWRPDRRARALTLAALLLAVTFYLLTVPPGELERYGCQCFGERFRFQDIRDHLRFNGVLIVMAVVGAWMAKPGREVDELHWLDEPAHFADRPASETELAESW